MNTNHGDARTGRIRSLRRRLNPRLNTRGERVVYVLSVFATLILSTGLTDRLMGFRAPITGVGLLDSLLIFAGFLIAPLVLASVALTIFTFVRNRAASGTGD